MSKEKATSSGVGLGGLVFIVFLILKLGEIGQVANWSWWWVTSPLWIPFAIMFAIFGIIALVGIIAAIFSK